MLAATLTRLTDRQGRVQYISFSDTETSRKRGGACDYFKGLIVVANPRSREGDLISGKRALKQGPFVVSARCRLGVGEMKFQRGATEGLTFTPSALTPTHDVIGPPIPSLDCGIP